VKTAQYLGARRMAKGILYMTLFRLRQPRRDFFVLAPIVSDLPWWAVCVVLHVKFTGTVFAWSVPVPLFCVSLWYALGKLAPPVWLYLGASEFNSFRSFHLLRYAWAGINGVTLLNRGSDAGMAAYDVEARVIFRRNPLGQLFRNPGTPRTWSLRTRPELWTQTVKALIDLVAVVVVDVRTGSEPVQYEIEWLAKPGRLEKTWLLAPDDRRIPAVLAAPGGDSPLPSQAFLQERLVTEEMLLFGSWGPEGLRVDAGRHNIN